MLHDGLILSPFNTGLPCLLASPDKTLRLYDDPLKGTSASGGNILNKVGAMWQNLPTGLCNKSLWKADLNIFCPWLQDEWAELLPSKGTLSQASDLGSLKVYLNSDLDLIYFFHVPGDFVTF